MGLVMVIAAVLIFRSRRGGIILYAIAFIASIVWAISGWTYWPLFSRLFALGVAFPRWSGRFWSRQPAKKGRRLAWQRCWRWPALVSFGWMFQLQPLVSASEAVPVKPVAAGEQQKNWAHWGNTTHGDRLPPSTKINKQNVDQLQVAWSPHRGYPAEQGPARKTRIRRCRLAIRFTSVRPTAVLALDVDSGKENGAMVQATAPNWQLPRLRL